MLKTSRETATVDDYGPVVDRHTDGEGQTIEFVEFKQDIDSAPFLKGLPGDMCTCPHWGYVLKGTVTFIDGEHEQSFEPGDAFYVAPGHLQKATAGTEYLQFSPTEQMNVVEAAMMKNMERMQQMPGSD
jgi:hypothetical protein